jgi:DNA helicase-2/ATP-dependent DNA helicase PcrA
MFSKPVLASQKNPKHQVHCSTDAPRESGILDLLRRELNEEQYAAVTAPVDIPVLVMAGPGSGKTRVLTYRMAYLIAQGLVRPSRLLAVTFTNKAADEMKERVMALLTSIQGSSASTPSPTPLVGTIHSACVRILHLYGGARKIPSDFIIYTEAESRRVIRDLLLTREAETPTAKKIAQISGIFSDLKNEAFCVEFGDAPEAEDPAPSFATAQTFNLFQEAQILLPQYQAHLKRVGALDFDDLILEAGRLLRDHPSIRSELQRRWEYLLVDETQDTSRAQYHVLRLLAERGHDDKRRYPIFLVGDPDQSIYGWRGADSAAIRRFRDLLPRTLVYLLETNYRCSNSVARFAQFIIEQDRSRVQPEKRMRTVQNYHIPVRVVHCSNPKAEAEFVIQHARTLISEHGLSGQDIAIMYRTNALSRELEETCVRQGVPYTLIGGLPFYERREIKDILACLKLLHNEDDTDSFARVLGFAISGVGPRTIETFLQWTQARHCSPLATLRSLRDMENQKSASSTAASQTLIDLVPHPRTVEDGAEKATVTEYAADFSETYRQLETLPLRADKRRRLLSFLALYEEWKALVETRTFGSRHADGILAKLIRKIIRDTRYEQHLRKLAPHGPDANEEASTIIVQERLENVSELVRAASAMEGQWSGSGIESGDQVLAAFLREVALIRGVSNEEKGSEKARESIGLMTLHTSKGLEFEAVFIVGLVEGVLPHKLCLLREKSIAEERRLAYVGFTRAKRFLIMTWYQQGKQTLSRFVRDVPDSLLSRHRAEDLLLGIETPIPQSQYVLIREPGEPVRLGDVKLFRDLEAMLQDPTPDTSVGKRQPQISRRQRQNICPGMIVRHTEFGKGVVIKTISNSILVLVRFFDHPKSRFVPEWQLSRFD